MLRNYLLIAFRNLRRQPAYAAINVVGLGVGMAACLLIGLFVWQERTYDRFHENEVDLYRVVMRSTSPGDTGAGAYTSQAMGPALAASIPEIRSFARVGHDQPIVTSVSDPSRVFEEDGVIYVDRAFLEMFSFPLVAGSDALAPGTVLLSESTARRYFGGREAIGEVLDFRGMAPGEYRIAGIFRDVPVNSHLQFDFILPMEDLLRTDYYAQEIEDGWSWNNFTTYLQLHPGADPATVDRKMTDVLMAHRGEIMRERGQADVRLAAQRLRDVYLQAADVGVFIGIGGNYRTVRFFTIIGLVTLLIALVNYVNLATARALDRAREVGVRKAIGAQRKQLIAQFLSESALTVAASAVLAVALAALLTPLASQLADTRLTADLWMQPGLWAVFLATLAAATLLAGLYPAFVLSSFSPLSAIRGNAQMLGGRLRLRQGLVVFQFAAAVVLIGGTAVVYSQLHYMRTMDLGIDLEQVLTVRGPGVLPEGVTGQIANTAMVEELRRMPAVLDVTTSWNLPGQGFNWNGASLWREEHDEVGGISARVAFVDTNFVAFYGLELLAGQGFAHISEGAEIAPPFPYMVTETTARALGFATPEQALGHPLRLGAGIGYELEVVGVLRDFEWSSAHHERDKALFGFTWAGPHYSIRVAAGELPATIAAIEAKSAELFPGNVFQYGFADETFAAQYRDDRRFATLFSLFAMLAIGIACLGLFGLASFTAQQRTKEIGVRKVLGASVPYLVGLLSRDFLKLVATAVVIGFPVISVLMSRWLEEFAFRIEIGPALFALVGLLTVSIALLSVAYQSIRAATADPVKALRTE